jgi:hypothetical protein
MRGGVVKQVFKIDDQGFYVEPVIIGDDEELGENLIETPIPEGFYRPKWNGNEWVEGLTSEEIEALKQQHQPQPSELDLLKQENAELKQRLEAAESAIIAIMDFM